MHECTTITLKPKIKGLVPFLSNQNYLSANSLSYNVPFPPKTSDLDFGTPFWFSKVKRSNMYKYGETFWKEFMVNGGGRVIHW